MQFVVYSVPFACYPRCQHAHKHLKQLCDRYKYLTYENLCDGLNPVSADPSGKINDDNPEFYVCLPKLEKDIGKPLEIEDVLKRNEGPRVIGTVRCEKLPDLFRTKADNYLMEKYVVLLTEVSVNEDDVPQSDNVQTIEVIEDVKDGDESRKVLQNLHMSLKEGISDQVSNLMEQNIYKACEMKTKCENLKKTLDIIQEVDACRLSNFKEHTSHNKDSSQQRPKSEVYKTKRADVFTRATPTKRIKSAEFDSIISHDIFDLSGLVQVSSKPKEEHSFIQKLHTDIIIESEKDNSKKLNGGRTVRKHLPEQVERIERLYGEIKGMFTRSRVPKDEQPQFDNQFDGIVNDKLKEDLRQLSPSIRSFGFRFRSVLVFVEANCDQERLKPGIERVLKKHNLHAFSIVSSKVRELSSCNVGSEVAANYDDGTVKCGTVGGFGYASIDEGNKTICLVSRHVVTDPDGNPASKLKVLNDGHGIDASILVDKSIRDNREIVLDIASASFEGDESQFDTKYKTSEEKAATGRLNQYGLDDLKGLPVHICGSKTSMGFGTITVPKVEGVQDSSMNDFIVIEDRENPRKEKEPFCKAGDSGSIVCADDQENPDNVQLISMVMGEDTQEAGTYYSLKLEKGVTQVKEEIKANNIQLL